MGDDAISGLPMGDPVPAAVMEVCRECGGSGVVESPVSLLARWNAARDEFVANNRYVTCPSCRKRASARYDVVNAHDATLATVTMHCHHCGHAWEQPRHPDNLGGGAHTRTGTSAGPDYCHECSERAKDWVKWPCPVVEQYGGGGGQ